MKRSKSKKSDEKGGVLESNAMAKREKKKTNKGSGGRAEENAGGEDGGGVVTDPRFSAAHSDPRFRRPPRHQAKVPIDARFRRMFTDPSFASASAAPGDKRGRPKRGDAREHPLLRYYGRKEEEEEEEGGSDEGVDSLSMELEPSDSEKMKDLGSDEESSSEESSSSDEEDSDVNYSEDDVPSEKEDVPLIEKETRRLAIVNMDWSHVKAVDLYVLLSSFLPKGGELLSVAVYPSDFGVQRMEYESKHGPAGLIENDEDKNLGDDNDEDSDSEIKNEKLRAYEKSRLRYYFAVAEFDSIATADYIYKTCDGTEFERTSNVLDLRFVPDDMEFKHTLRDKATEVPANYQALDFHTSALQQSQIHLSWDEDEPERKKIMQRKFNAKQLDELEFKEFLASDGGESDEEEESEHEDIVASGKKPTKRDLYRALLDSGNASDSDGSKDKDMEVTFNTGLEDISKKMLEKKDKKAETIWEAYLRKRKEKKKARKKGSKFSSEDESAESDHAAPDQSDGDEFFLDEPSYTEDKHITGGVNNKNQSKNTLNESKTGVQKSSKTDGELEATREELELLLADEGDGQGVRGYHIKPKRKKGKKGKREKEIPAEEKLPTLDYDDPRFTAMFTSPLFAVDPTDPQFKRSAKYARQMLHKQQEGHGVAREGKETKFPLEVVQERVEQLSESKKRKLELTSLVRSIKRKVESLPK